MPTSPFVSPFINGGAPVADASPIANAIGRVMEDRRQSAAIEQQQALAVDSLTNNESLAKLAAIDPQAATALGGLLQRRDAKELSAAQAQLEQDVRNAQAIRSIEDPEQRRRFIAQSFAETRDPELLELANMSPEDQELALLRTISRDQNALDAVIASGLPGSASKTLVEGVDSEGNPVFAQALENGGVNIIEGLTPPAPSAKEIAQTRQAEASAVNAERSVVENEEAAAAADSASQAISDQASALLDNPDAIDRVYGNVGGILPTLRPDSVDAEADIDKLVGALTLENTDKLRGTISDTDLQLLRDSGSVLGNKRISEARAKQELRTIRDVFSRNKEKIDAAESRPINEMTDAQLEAILNGR